jgi:hypothetical protein
VIAGGLIDPESTTAAFRERYMNGIRNAALPYMFAPQQKEVQFLPASLGELSQCVGAALVAKYRFGE